jgi:hypothetical protein
VRDRINRAKDRVNRSARAVEHVRRRLAERQAATRTRLTALESQRRELLS